MVGGWYYYFRENEPTVECYIENDPHDQKYVVVLFKDDRIGLDFYILKGLVGYDMHQNSGFTSFYFISKENLSSISFIPVSPLTKSLYGLEESLIDSSDNTDNN